MKVFLVLAATVVASSWPYYDLAFPNLERRMLSAKGGELKLRKERGGGIVVGPLRTLPDSPPREGDTRVSAKAIGPGLVAVGREKHEPHLNSVRLEHGQSQTKETHDPTWSIAQAEAQGPPPVNAGRQDVRLHPAKVEGTGQNGNVQVRAPRGGYGRIKKEVDGRVVRDDRVQSGQRADDSHVGGHPGEVKYSASSSRGGTAHIQVNNMRPDP